LDLFKALDTFQLSQFTEFTFTPSHFSFGDSDFTFHIGYETFKCSTYSAFVLSKNAQRLYNDENITSMLINIPPQFARRESKFVEHFGAFFGLIFGQSIVVDAKSFEAFFEISNQLGNARVFDAVSKFILSQSTQTLADKPSMVVYRGRCYSNLLHILRNNNNRQNNNWRTNCFRKHR
jgi:hypothetical protein